MKVNELIEKLQIMDQDNEVLCYSEDESLVAINHGFRLLDIIDVSIADGIKVRGDDQVPYMIFEKGPNSQKHAFIEVTAVF